MTKDEEKRVLEVVVKRVVATTGVPWSDLFKRGRGKRVDESRLLVMGLCVELGMKKARVAQGLGRDWTTIHWALGSLRHRLAAKPELWVLYDELACECREEAGVSVEDPPKEPESGKGSRFCGECKDMKKCRKSERCGRCSARKKARDMKKRAACAGYATNSV